MLVRETILFGRFDFSNWNELMRSLKKSNARLYLHKTLTTEQAVKASTERVLSEIDGSVNSLREMKAKVLDKLEAKLSTTQPRLKTLPWTILPPSDDTIRTLTDHFRRLSSSAKWDDKPFDLSGLKRIEQLKAQFLLHWRGRV